jgi:hypothetical protein
MTRPPSQSRSAPLLRAGSALTAALLIAAYIASGSNSATAATAAAKSNGLSGESPAQIVAASQAALRSAKGFVLTGALTESGKAVKLQLIYGGGSKLQVLLSQSNQTAEIIALPGTAYIRANAAYWKAQAPKAVKYANRWVVVPATTGQQFASSLGSLAPGTLAQCLGENNGKITRDGTTTVDGEPALVLRQSGTAPGTGPGTLAIATTGAPYPLRVTSTGATRPGGKVDVCNNGKGDDSVGSVTLSDFNHAPAITAPKHAVKAS